MQNINVDEIMNGIRADIQERGLEDTDIQFEDVILQGKSSDNSYEEQEFVGALDKARPHKVVNAAPNIHGNVIARVIKKVIRRIMAFHIEAIVDDQNEYNIYSYQAISMLPDRFQEEDSRIAALEEKLYECQKRIAVLEKQLIDKQN